MKEKPIFDKETLDRARSAFDNAMDREHYRYPPLNKVKFKNYFDLLPVSEEKKIELLEELNVCLEFNDIKQRFPLNLDDLEGSYKTVLGRGFHAKKVHHLIHKSLLREHEWVLEVLDLELKDEFDSELPFFDWFFDAIQHPTYTQNKGE